MVKITPAELGIQDEDLARRVLVRARTIAPCLDSFPEESEDRRDVIAILKGVIAELPKPGTRNVRAQAVNNASVQYRDIASAFDGDATASLRSLCGATTSGALPVGSFPDPSGISRLWPEKYS